MLNEIKGVSKPFPYQTLSIAICAMGVTVATLIFPNFINVFGSNKPDLRFFQYFSLEFQHGYDATSALLHLLPCVIIFLFMGGTLEKIIGPLRFFMFNSAIILVYGITHQIAGLIGHGLTPVLFAYIPFIAYALNESRLIKTRSMYDEYYKTLWAFIIGSLVVIPILLSIIPIYFDANAHFTEQIIRGNILHIVLLITGSIFAWYWKEIARHRLLYFAKKKKFPIQRFENYSFYFALFYPLLLIFIFLTGK